MSKLLPVVEKLAALLIEDGEHVEEMAKLAEKAGLVRYLLQVDIYRDQCGIRNRAPPIRNDLMKVLSDIEVDKEIDRRIAWQIVLECTEVYMQERKKDSDNAEHVVNYVTRLEQIQHPDIKEFVAQLPNDPVEKDILGAMMKLLDDTDTPQKHIKDLLANLA